MSEVSFSLRMVLFTKESGSQKKILKTEEAFKFGQMALDTMVSGETVWPMDTVVSYMQRVMFMRESGLKIKLMVSVFTLTIMEVDMKANGFRISNMAMESNNGQTVPNTKDNTNKE